MLTDAELAVLTDAERECYEAARMSLGHDELTPSDRAPCMVVYELVVKLAKERSARRALAESRRWVAVGERLPENSEDEMLVYQEFNRLVFLAKFSDNRWLDENYDVCRHVTHWQPLPSPPDAKEDGE